MTTETESVVARPGTIYNPDITYTEWAGDEDTTHTPIMGWIIYEDGDDIDRKIDDVVIPGRLAGRATYVHAGFLSGIPQSGPSLIVANDCHDTSWGDRPQQDNLWKGAYLNYDGSLSETPTNQWGYLPEWRADVARFCHSFDSLPGFESFNQLSANQKITTYRVGQTMGGHAWERLGFWLTYDASLSGDWKLPIVFDPVKKARDAVCIECQSATGARRLALSIDASAFATKLSQGRIHQTDRSVNPWIPGDLLTVVPAPDEEITIATAISAHVAAFNAARDYYDSHVAHEVIEHDHD